MGEALTGGTRWGLSSAAAPCRGRFWDRLLVGLVGVLGAGVALLPSARPAAACGGSGEPLCANIGHSLWSDPQEWETGNPDPLPAGQSTTVYFRALDDLGNPIDNDDDPDLCDGRIVMDEAVYTWYWFYPSTSKSDTGLSQSRNYSYPGKRTVGLFVDDVPGPPGCQDDSAQIDSVVVTLPLTLKMDWMEGYELTLTGMHAVWATGGHKLEIDPDHNTDCEYHPYLGDELYLVGDGEGFYDYMAEYETED